MWPFGKKKQEKPETKNDAAFRAYMSNITELTQEAFEKMIEKYQSGTDHKYKPKDCVKSAIRVCNGGCKEYMWIVITSVDEEKRIVTGTLENDPFHRNPIVKLNDVITVRFEDIMAFIPYTENAANN